MNEEYRRCSSCREDFPATLDYFYKTKKKYLSSWCKGCFSMNSKEKSVKMRKKQVNNIWRSKNKNRVKHYNSRYYQRSKRRKNKLRT